MAAARRRGSTVAATGVAAMLGLGMLAAGTASADPFAAPGIERIISGPSRPGIAAWGLAWNQVSGELVVGDYVSNQVRRFSTAGVHLGDFANPKGSTEGVASALGVDPRDGSVYLAVTGDGRTSKDVRKYTKDGQFLFDFDLPGSVTWLTVDSQGDLWVPQAWGGARVAEFRVSDATRSATQLQSFGSGGTGPGQLLRLTGIAVDEAGGSVWVSDPGNATVHQFTLNGTWVRDLDQTAAVFTGDIRGLAFDPRPGVERLYVANSNEGTIEVFARDGAHLDTWGGLGESPGLFPDGPRQLAVTPDGHVWAADYGARRVQRFAPDGTLQSVFPDPGMPADPAGSAGPRGVAYDPTTGDILVADSWNQRVQRFGADGTLKQVHGRRGTFIPEGMNYPRSVAVDPATGNVWLANYEGNPDLVVYTPDFGGVVRRIQTPRFVNDMEFSGGKAYVLVRRNGSVMVYDAATGTLERTCCTSLGLLRGIAVDERAGTLWLTSDRYAEAYVVDAATGSLLRKIPLDNRGWGVTIVGEQVHVADAGANKLIVFDRQSYARIGTYGAPGLLPGQLRGPSGITTDGAGRIYTVEERNNRVSVFTTGARPAPETNAPTVAMATPAAVVGTPLVVSGTAADDSGAVLVEVTVKDIASGQFWNARTGVWGTSTWNQAIVSGELTAPDWRFQLVTALPGHQYRITIRARDLHGNLSATTARTFTVS